MKIRYGVNTIKNHENKRHLYVAFVVDEPNVSRSDTYPKKEEARALINYVANLAVRENMLLPEEILKQNISHEEFSKLVLTFQVAKEEEKYSERFCVKYLYYKYTFPVISVDDGWDDNPATL